jgi:DNA-binding response OmpR family regulator
MRRRILLVDDEVAVLLTLKAVLEISGFDVDTAASAREGVSRLHTRQYHMLITDMRMESDAAGVEVIKAARAADYHPAIALLTAFPVSEEDWQQMGADQLLVKPMHTRILLQQIEDLIAAHDAKLARLGLTPPSSKAPEAAGKTAAKKTAAKKTAAKKIAAKKAPSKQSVGKKAEKTMVRNATKAGAKKAPKKKALAKKGASSKVAKPAAKKLSKKAESSRKAANSRRK